MISNQRDLTLPVCHLLPVPAEGVVRWSGLTTAQRLPETAVKGAEASQAGYELPKVERKCSTQTEAKIKKFS